MQERGTVATLTSELDPKTAQPVALASAPHRLLVAGLVAAGIVAADQLTKWWAADRLSHGSIHVLWKLDLRLERNTGSAFSLFQGDAVLLVALIVLLIVGLIVLVWRSPSVGRAAILGLVIGGALGNLSDRVFRGDHGAVIDFVDFHFWPTFNLADSSIVIGCILLALSFIRGETL